MIYADFYQSKNKVIKRRLSQQRKTISKIIVLSIITISFILILFFLLFIQRPKINTTLLIIQSKKNELKNITTDLTLLDENKTIICTQLDTLTNEKNKLIIKERTLTLQLTKLKADRKSYTFTLKLNKDSPIIHRTVLLSTLIKEKDIRIIEEKTKCSIDFMCFDSNRDGMITDIFHNQCDELSPTLTVMKSTSNTVFGGFTYQTWDGDAFKNDDDALVFDLNREQFYKHIKGTPSINTSPDLFPSFGKDDIIITGQPQKNLIKTKYQSYDGFSYIYPNWKFDEMILPVDIVAIEVFYMFCK